MTTLILPRINDSILNPKISKEHITNNKVVRKTRDNRSIIPEKLPAEEDTDKLPSKI